MSLKEELIYDLVFSEECHYILDLSKYVDNIYEYEYLMDEIKIVLKKSKITIVKSTVKVDSKTAIWELKLRK